MAYVDLEAAAGGKDILFEVGTLKVSLLTQTAAVTAGSQISPKGFNRVIGMICTQGTLDTTLSGYSKTAFSEVEGEVSVTGGATTPTHYLIFGY